MQVSFICPTPMTQMLLQSLQKLRVAIQTVLQASNNRKSADNARECDLQSGELLGKSVCSTVLIIWILTYSEYWLQVGANLHKCLNGFFTFSAQMDSKEKYKLQSVRLGPQCEFVLVKSENCPFGQFCARVRASDQVSAQK